MVYWKIDLANTGIILGVIYLTYLVLIFYSLKKAGMTV